MSTVASTTARALFAAAGMIVTLLFIYGLGVWLELLWYSAQDSSSRFWEFTPARAGFALAGAALVAAIAWAFVASIAAPLTRAARFAMLLLAGLAGAIWGLGLWEFLAMLSRRCESVQIIQALELCYPLL